MDSSSIRFGRSAQRGFTLIEVMIVVAIVAILAAVALPSYAEYVRRGALPEAFSSLSALRVRLEQYFQDHRDYGAAGDCADGTIPAAADNTKYFTYSCVSTVTGYTLTATGRSTEVARGHTYTLTEGNAKSTTSFKGASVGANTCWMTKSTSEC